MKAASIADALGGPQVAGLCRRLGVQRLEAMLGTSVDLISDHPIANPYLRAAVDASRRVVYDDAAAETSV